MFVSTRLVVARSASLAGEFVDDSNESGENWVRARILLARLGRATHVYGIGYRRSGRPNVAKCQERSPRLMNERSSSVVAMGDVEIAGSQGLPSFFWYCLSSHPMPKRLSARSSFHSTAGEWASYSRNSRCASVDTRPVAPVTLLHLDLRCSHLSKSNIL